MSIFYNMTGSLNEMRRAFVAVRCRAEILQMRFRHQVALDPLRHEFILDRHLP